MKKTILKNSIYLELITEIAAANVETKFGSYCIEDDNGNLVYDEDQQDYFNSEFDFIESLFNLTGNIYSD
tara:strand:- start:256 stop:465 length:210 start_codon:yes stop_codon:yes gene_type:complete